MKTLQIFLLSLLVAWQGWALSKNFNLEYEVRPVTPSTAWQAASSDRDFSVPSRPPVQLGTLMSAAVFSPIRELKAKPKPVVKAPAQQPPVARPAAPVQPQPARAALRLEGVLMSSSQQKALLREVDTEERKWIGLGEKFKGWTLIEISALEIVVESGEQRSKLPLYVDNR